MWLSIVVVSAHAQVVTFDLVGPWALRDDAAIVGGEIALAGDKPNQRGAAWVDSAFQLPTGGGFHARFEVRLDSSNSATGGLVFAIQGVGNNALGSDDEGMGYEGIAPSFAVEMDLWQSTDSADPNDNHVGLDLDGGMTSIATTEAPLPLGSGRSVFVWVDYVANELHVSLTDSGTQNGPLLVKKIPLPDALVEEQALWVGFTASTGGGPAQQRVVRDFLFIADGDSDGDALLDYEDPEPDVPSDTDGPLTSDTSDTALAPSDLPRVFFCSCGTAPRASLWVLWLVPLVLKRRHLTTPRSS